MTFDIFANPNIHTQVPPQTPPQMIPPPPPLSSPPSQGMPPPPPFPPQLPQQPPPVAAAPPVVGAPPVTAAPAVSVGVEELTVPQQCGLIGIDVESGGLDPRINPLLSMSVLACTGDVREIDGFQLHVLPPQGTVIELTDAGLQGDLDARNRPKRGYMDVYTKQLVDPSIVQSQQRPIVGSYAADINGYVRNGDLNTIDEWHRCSLPVQRADEVFTQFIKQCYVHPPIPVAHNASFDEKFTSHNLVGTVRYLGRTVGPMQKFATKDGWLCTMRLLQRWNTRRGVKGRNTATLRVLEELAGVNNSNAHDALEDCRTMMAGLRWLRQQAWD